MKRVRFNKTNILNHIENRMSILIAQHGERIQGGYHGIHIMLQSERRDELMRAWGEHDVLNRLYWDIVNGEIQ